VKVRWGVIGAGGIADRRTIPEGILPAENSELVAVMTPHLDRVNNVARKYGVDKCYTSERDIVKDADVDAVYVASPVNAHARQAVLAAEAGKHILCEKPLALTIDECKKVVSSCRRNRVKLMVGFMMRFHACHKKAKEIIDQGTIGKPVLGRAQLTCWYPKISGSWRQDPRLGGGGALMDMGIHCIDLMRMLIGEVAEVAAFTGRVIQNYHVEDSSTVIMRHRNKAHSIVDNNFNIPDAAAQNSLEIYGSAGCILGKGTIGQSSSGKIVVKSSEREMGYEASQIRESLGMRVEEIEPSPVNIYRAEIEHFAHCILHDEEPINSGKEALRNQQIVLAAYRSAKVGRTVKV